VGSTTARICRKRSPFQPDRIRGWTSASTPASGEFRPPLSDRPPSGGVHYSRSARRRNLEANGRRKAGMLTSQKTPTRSVPLARRLVLVVGFWGLRRLHRPGADFKRLINWPPPFGRRSFPDNKRLCARSTCLPRAAKNRPHA
jgi:hypothetical protein